MKAKLQPVVVVWKDSYTFGGSWELKENLVETAKETGFLATSAGFLFYKDKNYVTIVQSFTDKRADGALKIPRSTVISIKEK